MVRELANPAQTVEELYRAQGKSFVLKAIDHLPKEIEDRLEEIRSAEERDKEVSEMEQRLKNARTNL